MCLLKLVRDVFGVDIDPEKELAIVHRSGKNGCRMTAEFTSRRPGSAYMQLLRKSRNRETIPDGKR